MCVRCRRSNAIPPPLTAADADADADAESKAADDWKTITMIVIVIAAEINMATYPCFTID